MTTRIFCLTCLCLLALSFSAAPAPEVAASLEVSPVWSGHPVGFALLTAPPLQYAAYFDADREMTVAWRTLGDDVWQYRRLDSRVGWDSHNSIAMTRDAAGRIHLAGNMHNDPLTYFRTAKSGDPDTFERLPMTGELEDRVTYPVFHTLPDGRLMFMYRDGGSGKGNQILNVQETDTGAWSRLLDIPVVDGEGQRNAYLDAFQSGPDGMIHVCWVWRDSYLCETNHTLSYARSPDMLRWFNARGEPLELPIRFGSDTVVDPVAPGGGLLNGNARLSFDGVGRPVIVYMKYDEEGHSQLYAARLEAEKWRVAQITDWTYRWEFQGGGTIPWEIGFKRPEVSEDGGLVMQWSHKHHGSERWRLDDETLRPVEKLPNKPSGIPSALREVESDFPAMRVKFAWDSGEAEEPDRSYLLRWETLPQNRDQPREKPWPEPSMLRLYAVSER